MFEFIGLDEILPALLDLKEPGSARILLLGKTDWPFTYEGAARFLEQQGVRVHPVPEAERRTTDTFAWVANEDWWKYRDFIHQSTLFQMLGFRPDNVHSLDVDDYEHAEIIQDMNQPLAPGLGQYDLVIELGTLEHVFDVRQALWNVFDLVRVGGSVFHGSPAAWVGHAFYNFDPILFADFYEQSGWERLQLCHSLIPQPRGGPQPLYGTVAPGVLREFPAGFYVNVLGWFRKTEHARKIVPMQGGYVGLHEACNHRSRDSAPGPPAPPRARLLQRLAAALARPLLALDARLQQARGEQRIRALGGEVVRIDRRRR